MSDDLAQGKEAADAAVAYGKWLDSVPVQTPEKRLEELRALINAEPPERGISQGEILELESLAAHIEPHDVELLQWAGVPEKAVIRSDTDDPLDGIPLFWSNAQGWVSRSEADEFDVREQRSSNLPIGGHWENADDYDRDVALFTQAMQEVERP